MSLNFEDLTEDQILEFWNGVGSNEFFIRPPHLIFGKASIKHDFYYFVGGNENDRKKADKLFLKECLDASKKQKHWYKKYFYIFMSYIYYFGLRKLGNKGSFEFGKKAETWEQLRERIIKDRLSTYDSDSLK